MHFRVSTRRKGGKVYHYGQIVQSYRREDGMPAHRVILSLGRVTLAEAEVMKRLVKALVHKEPLVLAAELTEAAAMKCSANFQYLALAVFLQLWRRLEVGKIIDDLVPESNVEVPVSTVVAALVFQRCLAPASKLAAVDWFAETALPELLHVKPSAFNNTRVHRALEALEIIEKELQQRLARHIIAQHGAVKVLFLDCTDTWFVGQGPECASKRQTKEGLFKRQVGIALVCNQDGLPLSWATVDGGHDERQTMMRLVREATQEAWAHQVPFVMDRAMGCESSVRALIDEGVRFVTAVPCSEFAAYSTDIPLGSFDEVSRPADELLDAPEYLARLGERARALGFQEARGGQFLLDLGVVSKKGTIKGRMTRARATLALALRAASELDRLGAEAARLAQRWGVSARTLRDWRTLLKLSSDVQERILRGEADRLTGTALVDIAKLPAAAQLPAFEKAVSDAGSGQVLHCSGAQAALLGADSLRVRAIVSFRPELFVRNRSGAEATLASVLSRVDDLNERLRSTRSHRDPTSALAEVAALARKHSLTSVVKLGVDESGACPRLTAVVDDEAWGRRRASDGINLIIAHEDEIGAADALVALYYGKDKVEKCFRTIKSVMELRPVYHRTDHKVRAHVTLCVLGLLLERTLQVEFQRAELDLTANQAARVFRTCFLNRFDEKAGSFYTTTQPTPDQLKLLEALDMEHLVDDDAVASVIRPR